MSVFYCFFTYDNTYVKSIVILNSDEQSEGKSNIMNILTWGVYSPDQIVNNINLKSY